MVEQTRNILKYPMFDYQGKLRTTHTSSLEEMWTDLFAKEGAAAEPEQDGPGLMGPGAGLTALAVAGGVVADPTLSISIAEPVLQ